MLRLLTWRTFDAHYKLNRNKNTPPFHRRNSSIDREPDFKIQYAGAISPVFHQLRFVPVAGRIFVADCVKHFLTLQRPFERKHRQERRVITVQSNGIGIRFRRFGFFSSTAWPWLLIGQIPQCNSKFSSVRDAGVHERKKASERPVSLKIKFTLFFNRCGYVVFR